MSHHNYTRRNAKETELGQSWSAAKRRDLRLRVQFPASGLGV